MDFRFEVIASAETLEEAVTVMNERVEEDYGFDYQISYHIEEETSG